MKSIALALAAFLAISPATAGGHTGLMERWYTALAASDAAAADALLSRDATFRLEEFDRDMTREEFIEELRKNDAMKVRHRVAEETTDSVTALVCYTLDGDTDLARREAYTVVGGKIVRGVQYPFGNDCRGI
jgi:ketosteroid isomerase-like protein